MVRVTNTKHKRCKSPRNSLHGDTIRRRKAIPMRGRMYVQQLHQQQIRVTLAIKLFCKNSQTMLTQRLPAIQFNVFSRLLCTRNDDWIIETAQKQQQKNGDYKNPFFIHEPNSSFSHPIWNCYTLLIWGND